MYRCCCCFIVLEDYWYEGATGGRGEGGQWQSTDVAYCLRVKGEAGGRQVNPLPATNYRLQSSILPPLYNLPDSPLHSLHLPPKSPPSLPPTRRPGQCLLSVVLQNSAAWIFTWRSEKASNGRDGGRSEDSLFVLPKVQNTIIIRCNRLSNFSCILRAMRMNIHAQTRASPQFHQILWWFNWKKSTSRLFSVRLIL